MNVSSPRTETVTLLRTKLHMPRLAVDLIERPQLYERLDRAPDRKLTLISAAAGYGKTTLVATWLQDSPRPVAWLSLDEDDSDLILFLNYFVAAIQTVFPDACPQTGSLGQVPQLPPVGHIATTLINEITDLSDDFIVVLDDFHTIRDDRINQLLARVIEHFPAQMHLVICSRTDPQLPLARLRVRRQIIEIRTRDLSLSQDEVNTYLAQALGEKLPGGAEVLLRKKTEGWIAGLQLAVLSMRYVDDSESFIQAFTGTNHNIMDFLMDEVLAQQPQAAQDDWLQLSLLNRFCAPLCQAMTDRSLAESQDLLIELERKNLFLVSLDSERYWYRYHHLFQELLQAILQARMSKKEVDLLHSKASSWLAANGFIEEALQHALAAGDTTQAVRLVEQHRIALLNRSGWHTLERWLNRLPHEIDQQRVELLLSRAWILSYRTRFEEQALLLQEVESLLDKPEPTLSKADILALRGEIDALHSFYWYLQHNDVQRSFRHAQRALKLVSPNHTNASGMALAFAALGHHRMGRNEVAVPLLNEAINNLAVNVPSKSQAFTALLFIHLNSAELNQLSRAARYAIELGTEEKTPGLVTQGHYFLGMVAYERNDLESAARHFSKTVEQRYAPSFTTDVNAMIGLALTYQAQGQLNLAQEKIEAAQTYIRESKNSRFLPYLEAYQIRQAFLQGDSIRAFQWTQSIDVAELNAPPIFPEAPILTLAKILISHGTPASLTKAKQHLAAWLAQAEEEHNTRQITKILAHLALTYDAKGQTAEALEALARAVTLAHPGGFVRVFVDLGPAMASLLPQLAKQGIAPEYIGQILQAFPKFPASPQVARVTKQDTQRELVEPLTGRELELLQLLAQRLSDQEIARLLIITHQTVRRHNSNIYQKLGVKNRLEAVSKAQALGILTQD